MKRKKKSSDTLSFFFSFFLIIFFIFLFCFDDDVNQAGAPHEGQNKNERVRCCGASLYNKTPLHDAPRLSPSIIIHRAWCELTNPFSCSQFHMKRPNWLIRYWLGSVYIYVGGDQGICPQKLAEHSTMGSQLQPDDCFSSIICHNWIISQGQVSAVGATKYRGLPPSGENFWVLRKLSRVNLWHFLEIQGTRQRFQLLEFKIAQNLHAKSWLKKTPSFSNVIFN